MPGLVRGSSNPAGEPRPPHVRAMRRARTAAILVVGSIALVLTTTKIVHRAWNHERCGATISRWASGNLRGHGGPTVQAFTFGRVDWPWLPTVRSLFWGPPARVDVSDVRIWDPDGREVLYADHVQTSIAVDTLVWNKLFHARSNVQLALSNAVIDHVECRLQPVRDGNTNLIAAFQPIVMEPEDGGGLVVSVDRSTVRGGSMRAVYPGWSAELDRLTLELDSLRYSSFASEQAKDKPAFTYRARRIEAETGQLHVDGVKLPIDHVRMTDFHAQLPRSEDLVMKGTAHSLGATFDVDGSLTDVYAKHIGASLDASARHVGGILAVLPTHETIGGDPSIKAHLKGPMASFALEGEGHGFVARLIDLTFEKVFTRFRLTKETLALRDCAAKALDGDVNGDVTIDLVKHRWTADIRVNGIKPLELKRLLPVTLFAYVAAVIPRLTLDAKGGKATTKLHIDKVDVELTQYAHEALPSRAQMTGPL